MSFAGMKSIFVIIAVGVSVGVLVAVILVLRSIAQRVRTLRDHAESGRAAAARSAQAEDAVDRDEARP